MIIYYSDLVIISKGDMIIYYNDMTIRYGDVILQFCDVLIEHIMLILAVESWLSSPGCVILAV